jgi:rod shape-determining protein MreC
MLGLSKQAWRRLRLFLMLLAVAAFLFLLPSRLTAPLRVLFNEGIGPVQTPVLQAGGRAVATSGTLTEMFLREDRERALLNEAIGLRNRKAALADQNRRLALALASLKAVERKDFPFRVAQAPVASYDTAAMRRGITVRAGRADGAWAGLAVASLGALVGVVAEAGPHQSRVRLITDPGSGVPCRLSRSRSVCILQGTGGPLCAVEWVDKGSFVERGDVIVTTSLAVAGGSRLRLPEGLPAATVVSVERDHMRPLFLAVKAKPRVNLDRLEAVEMLVPQEESRTGSMKSEG